MVPRFLRQDRRSVRHFKRETCGDGGSPTSQGPGQTATSGETTGPSPQGETNGPFDSTGIATGDTDSNSNSNSGPAGTSTGSPDGLPFSLDEVIWLYPDITDWAETITLSSISLEGELLCLNHDIASQEPAWPIVLSFGTTEVVGNAWIFIEERGQWYAATWEWLRPPGQTCKFAAAVDGGHIKADPFGEFSGWLPTSGQSYYFMVSGLIRNPNYANVMERSNIVEYVWP